MLNQKQWKDKLPVEDVEALQPVAGGSINEAYEVQTKSGKYFLLVQPHATVDFYAAEIAGLKLFEDQQVTAPKVVDAGQLGGDAYLLLSYLDEGGYGSQAQLGQLVAKLHRVESDSGLFGFDYPTDMADIAFNNQWTETWFDQFIKGRIDPMYDRIKSQGYWDSGQVAKANQAYDIMVTSLKDHESRPALLHGDLWSGNVMFLKDGSPAIFDPAPFYGDREFDLGATLTFGGFSSDFYQAYDQAYPLEPGAWDRIEFYNLYLLLLHLVKFGSSYQGGVARSMDKIIQNFA